MGEHQRVVITGMGVIAPNAHGLQAYEEALREGRSGIRFIPELKELQFGCQVGGVPEKVEAIKQAYFTEEELLSLRAPVIAYGCIAAVDAWRDAGLEVPGPFDERVNWDTGAVIGTGGAAVDYSSELRATVLAGKVRRMGAIHAQQMMISGVSARVAGMLALGGVVTTNSSACLTGVEAIIEAFESIREGRSVRMLAGASEGPGHLNWAGFDAMRVMATNHNDTPEAASRPMSRSAGGFVPSSGAAVLILESLEAALQRGARIHAEVLGTHRNCGGHRNGGSMTAPNPEAAQRCIRAAIRQAGVRAGDIDLINGHLTGTMADALEIQNWAAVLEAEGASLPKINATKSVIGHGLGAAGSLESVACILQLTGKFAHGSLNCQDLNSRLEPFAASIVHSTLEVDLQVVAKTSFGFGDVNGCVIFKRWTT